MSNSVAEIENKQVAEQTSAVLSMIERVASDPNSDIAKLEKMLDMQERVLDRNARQAFSADMAAMQSELPRVAKTAKAHNSTYAKLEDINDAIRPILQKHGFAVTFSVDQTEDRIRVVTHLSHREGHHEETSILLPADTSGSKNNVQAVGSTISYGKRYGICAILNISTGDDTDGNLPPSNEPDITDWLAKIDESADMESLRKNFKAAYSANNGHPNNQKRLNSAKDDKKKELSK